MNSGVIVVKLVNAANKQYNVILRSENIEKAQHKTREVLDLHGHNDSKILSIDVIKGEVII
jgi:hypothetical protein